MAGFYFRLELQDGTPADPPVLHTAVPNWQAGDTIPLGADRMLRVVEMRFVDEDFVLVVKPAKSAAPVQGSQCPQAASLELQRTVRC